jgi:PAS domain S-box-containing protein
MRADHENLVPREGDPHGNRSLHERDGDRFADLETAHGRLRQAAAKYRTLVERLPAIVYHADFGESGAWQYVSPQIESILGFTPEEWMADPGLWYRQIHPDDRERAIEDESRTRATGEHLVSEYRMFTRDGRVAWFRDEATMIPDAEGNTRSLQGIMYDITEAKRSEEALRRYTERVEGLRQIDLAILSAQTIEELIQAALSRLQDLVSFRRSAVWLMDFEAGMATAFVTSTGLDADAGVAAGVQYPIERWGSFGESVIQRLQRGEVDLRDDLSKEPDLSPGLRALQDEGIRSLLVAPMLERGDLIGVIALYADAPGAFDKEHAAITGEVGNQLAIAIRQYRLRRELKDELAERKRAEEAVRRYAERVEGLRQIDLAILKAQSVEEIVQSAVLRLQDLVPSDGVRVSLIDSEAQEMVVFSTTDTLATSVSPGARVPIAALGSFGIGLVDSLRAGQNVIIADLSAVPDLAPALQQLRDEGVRSLVATPLLREGELVGVLSLRAREVGALDGEDAAIAAEVANQLAIAIHQNHLRQQLEDELAERRRAEEEATRSEARKSAILESALDCVITIDHNGEILEFNPAAERTFGYQREDVVGKEMAELIIPPSLRQAHREGLARYLATGEGTVLGKRIELTGVRADGTEFPVELAIARVDLPGQPVFTGYLRDITERKQAEERIRETLADLRKTDEARQRLLSHLTMAQEEERSRIAADIHDDTIQVMTAVGMRLDILRRELQGPGQIELLEHLEETVRVATGRLRNLLFELHPPTLDRDGLAAALRIYLEQNREQTGLAYALEDHLAEEPSSEIRVILYRIAQEVLANARKHARASSLTVALESRVGGFLVRIADDGVGFSVSEEDYQRPGHLGLASIRERAEMAGGWSHIDSTPDTGTTVEFWLPAKTPERPEAER